MSEIQLEVGDTILYNARFSDDVSGKIKKIQDGKALVESRVMGSDISQWILLKNLRIVKEVTT